MLQALTAPVKGLASRLGFEQDWYLVPFSAVIGLVMSGVAMAFILPLEWLAERHYSPAMLWWLVPLAPMGGAFLCGLVTQLMPVPGIAGPGVSKVLWAVNRGKARLPLRMAVRKWIASTLTIGSGGSAGAEGPIVTIGSVFGSVFGQLLRTSPQGTATLLGCGAAAGLASVFNAPIAGVFFVMEILLRDFSLRTFTPIVIASVVSSASTQAVLGHEALFEGSTALSAEAFAWIEIPNYLMLGVLCGLAAALFVRVLHKSGAWFARLPVHPVLRPVIGAAMLGILGVAALAVSGGRVPHFYGNGYPVITQMLTEQFYTTETGALAGWRTGFWLLVGLAVMKGLATCLTIGSGGAGGMFAPSLLLGAATGGAFGFLVNALGWFPSASPALYALVGMAAMVAATTHAPLTAILIVYEITQSYEVILPLMLAAVISTITGRLVNRESVYTAALTLAGIRVGAMSDLTLLRRLSVSDVTLTAPVFVHPEESAERLLELSERMPVTDFVVTGPGDRYVGLVTGSDLKEALVYREAIPLLQVHELQRTNLPVVHAEENLDSVLDKFARHDVTSLVVLDETGNGRVIGLITRARLMQRYQQALEST